MSSCWDIVCVDCKAKMGIENANGAAELMRVLIAGREGFEKLVEKGLDSGTLEITADHMACVIPEFFSEHQGHLLKPINEYGRYDDQCGKYVRCENCDASHYCVLASDHEGEHQLKKP